MEKWVLRSVHAAPAAGASGDGDDDHIGSTSSISVPLVAPDTGNDLAGVRGAVEAEDVNSVGSVIGTASALPGG